MAAIPNIEVKLYRADVKIRRLQRRLNNVVVVLMREAPEVVNCPDCGGEGGGYNGEEGTEWECDRCWGSGWLGPALARQKQEVSE